jgi:hypothetical protein
MLGQVLWQRFGRHQGPTKLDLYLIDYSILADGLRANSRLKILSLHPSSKRVVANQDILAIASALEKKQGSC